MAVHTPNVLSLCTGGGGLDLGIKNDRATLADQLQLGDDARARVASQAVSLPPLNRHGGNSGQHYARNVARRQGNSTDYLTRRIARHFGPALARRSPNALNRPKEADANDNPAA